MARLIEFALSQRLLVLLAVVLLGGFGYRAFQQLPIDAFPDVSPTQVKIIIKAPGMTPEEVETRITAQVEVELLGIPRQVMLRSTTKYALTDITLDFEEGTDIFWARQQVAERLNGIWDNLPDDIQGGIAPMTTPLGDMFMFTVDGPLPLMERRTLLEWVIRPALRTVPGVADVNVLGGFARSFEVVPDPVRLAAVGLDTLQLSAAIEANNRNDGAGRLNEGEETLLVRAEGRIRTLDDLRALVIDQRAGQPITVGDVALVRVGELTRYGAVTQDGKGEAAEGLILGLRGANARELIAGVEAKLGDVRTALPDGIEVNVFYDRSNLVERAVSTVAHALGEAVVLVLILLVLFLGNVRAALTVAVVLPLAALMTFIMMRATGLSANLMSLGGLAIAIGMLVDAAVVVVENIETHISHHQQHGRLPRLHVIYRAVVEVAVPVTSGIGIIIIVFLPLLSMQGLEGRLFSPVALTIIFALSGSLLLSLTVIPVLASYVIKSGAHAEPWLPRKLQAAYRPLLAWCLQHSRTVVISACVALVLTLGLYPFLGKTFMPTMDEGDIIIQLEKIPSITLQESVALDQRIEAEILNQVPEVTRIVARMGSDEIGMDPMGLNESDVFLVLQPPEQWRSPDKNDVIEAIREVLDQFPGVAYGFTQPIEMRTSEMLTGVRGDVAIKLFGADLEELGNYAERIGQILRTVDGAEDVFVSRNEGVQYLTLSMDQQHAGRLGLHVDDLQRQLRTQLEGVPVGIVQEGIARTPILMRAGEQIRNSVAGLERLPVVLPDGGSAPLNTLAQIERIEGVVAVARERGQRFTVIRTNVNGRDLVGFVDEARARVAAEIDLPAGYYLEWGGQFENQQRAAARLTLVVPIAIGLIFLLLFLTFGSVRQALLVLTNVPFAIIGGVISLWLAREYLSVPASVGFIALLGIAVLNGVVMVTYFNQLRSRGLPIEQVVVEGAARRLRPVLMTASIAAFGLVPLLFANGPGSEIQRPLAIVVIGGLISATALTLILLPILYRRFGALDD
ncbi:MAG: efflux RND transporter permease subunit [Gammaproteobacteria bacterium]|nr:efflux RND transporter permease subunit [Gammaproteobacteria bacterium]